MSSTLNLAPHFTPIRGLGGVVVTTARDCLPYAVWQRTGETWDPKAIATTWELLASHAGTLSTTLGAPIGDGEVALTLELAHSTLIYSRVESRFGVAYVFGRNVPLGVARFRVQMLHHVVLDLLSKEELVSKSTNETKRPSSPGLPSSPSVASPSSPSAPSPARTLAGTSMGYGGGPLPGATAVASARALAPAPQVASAPAPTVAPSVASKEEPFSDLDDSFSDVMAAENDDDAEPLESPSANGNGSSTPRRSFARSGTDAPPDPEPSRVVAEPSMGSKLLAYLERYAPDTHAALLRVSLQTGLPVTLLRQPDNLSADEFSQVAESVRKILGVEQLNL